MSKGNSKWSTWSKKKKVLIVLGCIFIFLLVAIICSGIIALKWYCKTPEYNVVSVSDSELVNTKLIAHRGFRAIAPENTVPAFEMAGETGFWGAECDIFRTKDGVWVIQHDSNAYRMTGKVVSIENSTFDELQSYTVNNGSKINDYPDLSICTFEDYLKICDRYSMNAVIELKSKNNTEHYDEIVDIIGKYFAEVTFISFFEDDLTAMRKLTDAPMFYLVHEIDDDAINIAKKIGNCGIDFDGNKEKNIDDGWVKKCYDEKLPLGAWTINDINVMKNLVKNNVTYITTDCITY